jgi:hypothetical protein
MILKHFITTTVAAVALAGMAHADDDSFNGVQGAFGGTVSTFAKSGGVSATGSLGGYQNTTIRNESGSGEFAGASMTWSAEDGSASITGESFTDGFDFSETTAGGGYGGSFAARAGFAKAEGGFAGGFANGEFDDDWDDDYDNDYDDD